MANYFWLVKRGVETMKKRGLRWHMKMARWRLVWTFRKLVYVYSKKWSLIHGTWICAEKTLDPLITRCTFSNRAKLNNHPLSRYYSSIRSLLLFAAAVDAANATAISTAKKWGAATSNGKKLSLKWTEADYFYYQEHYFTCNIACVGRYLRWHSRKWSMAFKSFKLHVHLARKSAFPIDIKNQNQICIFEFWRQKCPAQSGGSFVKVLLPRILWK